MNAVDDSGPEHGGEDLLAAEYVLGVLPQAERQAVARRIEDEPAFASAVDAWEVRLSPLGAAYESLQPPAGAKAAIDRRLFTETPARHAPATAFWGTLGFWRGLATAALAALVIALAVPYLSTPIAPVSRLVASLAADGSQVRYLVFLDPAKGQVNLSHVSGDRPAGQDFELWMIQGGNPPVSMGIIPVGDVVHLALTPDKRALLDAGAVLAVSQEPRGGSPTGQPTGPVVAAGDLRSI